MLNFKHKTFMEVTSADFSSPVRQSIAKSSKIVSCFFKDDSVISLDGSTVVKLDKNSKPMFNSKLNCKGIVIPQQVPSSFHNALKILSEKGLVIFYETDNLSISSNINDFCENFMYRLTPYLTEYELDRLSVSNKRKFYENLTNYPSVSVVLCTNRLPNLDFIVPQIMNQIYPNFEIIFVNHGSDAKKFSEKIQILMENKPSATYRIFNAEKTLTFGESLSLGARASSGDFVAKFDDDDFYSAYHLLDIVRPTLANDFAIVGKSLNYVYIEPLDTTFIKKSTTSTGSSEHLSDWVAGGTMLINKDFGDKVSWFSAVEHGVDRDIQDKALSLKLPIYRTHGAGYVYSRTNNNHTWSTNWQRYMAGSSHQVSGVYGNF